MNKKTIIKAAVYLSVLLFSILFIVIGHQICRVERISNVTEYYTADVIFVGEVHTENATWEGAENTVATKTIDFIAKITDGDYKNREVSMQQKIDCIYSFQKSRLK